MCAMSILRLNKFGFCDWIKQKTGKRMKKNRAEPKHQPAKSIHSQASGCHIKDNPSQTLRLCELLGSCCLLRVPLDVQSSELAPNHFAGCRHWQSVHKL